MGLTCLVTVHGIGFQQPPAYPPDPITPGYADHLHDLLRTQLGDRLGEDPERPDQLGPVYVQSSWNKVPADGMARLDPDRHLIVPGSDADIAHVALVYAELEIPVGSRLGSGVDTVARALLALDAYAHPLAEARLLAADIAATRHAPPPAAGAGPGLAPRHDTHQDTPRGHQRIRHLLARSTPSGVAELKHRTSVLMTLEEDVASYVCRNDLRERVRGFVGDALDQLASRDDVTAIVLNTHSQGTVVGFDVLARSPHPHVRAFVTAGSPLRKYVDLFAWGDTVGCLGDAVEAGCRWINLYDMRDPVADPLRGGAGWRVGDDPAGADAPTLFRIASPEVDMQDETRDCPVIDIDVNNVAHSTGGLRAHNYWGNAHEVIPVLAGLLTDVAGPVRPPVAVR